MTLRLRNDGRALLCWTLLCTPLVAQSTQPKDAPPIPGVNLPTDPKKADETPIIRSSEVRVNEFGTCDLVVQNDDITNVLSKLAIQARRNIVPSAAVPRPVNATMYGVSFEAALDALLTPNGLAYEIDGDFVFVYTADELAHRRSAPNNLVSKRIMLDYLRSTDAMEFAQPLLSELGKITPTKDTGGGGGGGGDAIGAAVAGASGGSEASNSGIYTPDTDEFSLENAVVVHDVGENVERIENFLKAIDTQPEQVLLEATIIEVNLEENNAFGVDFAILDGMQFSSFFGFPDAITGINPLTGATNTQPPTNNLNRNFAVGSAGNAAQGDATIRVGITHENDVGVFIRALDQITDVSILSNPKVLALNRQKTKVMVGTRVAYLETTVVENQVLQTIKFIDTGITLEVRPYVLKDRRVRMEIYPKVSEVVFRDVTSLDGVVQQLPDEEVRTVQTDVLVPEGSTAVIGGLFREDTDRVRKQVPVLGDIPLVGYAFEGQDDTYDRVEVIFLIKPTVMSENVLAKQGDVGMGYYERVRVGSRLGLLPWSRERQSARWNLKAKQAADVGAYEQARYMLRQSLELHPLQPEVLRLQEQLKDVSVWPIRSMLERIVYDWLDADYPDGRTGILPNPPVEVEYEVEEELEESSEMEDDTSGSEDAPAEPAPAEDPEGDGSGN
jgi:type IV pilus assembly protein PilQ